MDPQDTASDFQRYVNSPDIDGLAIRTSWDTLEPQDDTYDWRSVDQAFAAAKSAHKKITLHILASGYVSPPAWLKAQGVQFYSESNPFRPDARAKEQAVPWDRTYIAKWTEFLGALAQHINQTGAMTTLSRISVGLPVPEMSLVACRNNLIAHVLTYSRPNYIWSWKASIYAMNAAFPSVQKIVSAPVAQICMPDNDGAKFYGEVVDYMRGLNPSGFGIYATDLNAIGSQRLENIGSLVRSAPVSFQFIGAYSDDPRNRFGGSLGDAICKGYKEYGSRYFEVYKQDILNKNQDVQAAIRNIHHLELCQ